MSESRIPMVRKSFVVTTVTAATISMADGNPIKTGTEIFSIPGKELSQEAALKEARKRVKVSSKFDVVMVESLTVAQKIAEMPLEQFMANAVIKDAPAKEEAAPAPAPGETQE